MDRVGAGERGASRKVSMAPGRWMTSSAERVVRAAVLPGLLLVVSCRSGEPPRRDSAHPLASAAPHVADGPRFVRGPTGGAPVAPFIRTQAQRSLQEKRLALVYVGATWCEPCQRFHDAVEAGRLDASFPRLDLIEFDLDVDRDALRDAGYESRLIPLFAVPGADGRASPRRMSGSIKGPKAVDSNLVPRLRKLLQAER